MTAKANSIVRDGNFFRRRIRAWIGIGLIGFLAAGCAGVKPWEREYLADPIMQFDSDREEKAVREHFLSTREGSAGSFGVSGGGCGCN